MGLNVRVGNLNELLYGDRLGFGRDGSAPGVAVEDMKIQH
jgi:hypothetical protein